MSNQRTARPTSTTVADAVAESHHDDYIDNARETEDDSTWESVAENAGVQAAFKGLAPSYKQPANGLVPAVKLLNAISLAYYDASTEDTTFPAVIFSLDKGNNDYLGARRSPNLISYPAPIERLREMILDSTMRQTDTRDWSTFLSAGEASFNLKHGNKFHACIDWWLNIIKMCRPDLSVVHGLHFADGPLRLSSFDANGISHSGDIPLRTLDAWIAHVVLVYDSLDKRDERLTYLGPGTDTARWMFKTGAEDGTEICVEPFWASSSTGRRTWAALSTCCHGGEEDPVHGSVAEGFLKMSWQHRKSGQRSEGQLFDIAHATSWLPGLARHWGHWKGDESLTIFDDDRRARVKEVIQLASVGQPLSRCRSVAHLFKVFFDAVKVHRALDDRGILHNDMSLMNLLCQPKHDPTLLEAYADKPVGTVKEVPCIGYILTGDKAQEPCALITDLDMSSVSKSKAGIPAQAPVRHTGTPKFVAVEQCTYKPERMLPLDRSVLDNLLKKLSVIDSDAYSTDRERMFPDGKADEYIAFVKQIFEIEAARPEAATTSCDIGHLPRHDVESLFWGLFYSLARACPVGFDPLDDVEGEYSRFLEAMFEHNFGNETRRPYFVEARFEQVLHPALRHFAPVLTSMLQYLSIPWHLHKVYHDDFIGRYHAHIAMERLLFAEIHAMTLDPSLDVRIDTEQPRIQNLLTKKQKLAEEERLAKAKAAVTPTPAATGTTASTTTVASGSTAATAIARDATKSQGPAKRKRVDETDPATQRSKRQKGDGTADPASLPPTLEEPVTAPSYDIRHMSEMIWRYRHVWFGRGKVPLGPKQPAMDAQEEWLFSYRQLQRKPKK